MDIQQNIVAGKYKNNTPIVQQPPMPALLRLSASQMTSDQMRSLPALSEEYETKKKASQENSFQIQKREIEAEFEKDCAEECGLLNHPKRSALWQLAWDQGHANGLLEVWSHYREMAELLQP